MVRHLEVLTVLAVVVLVGCAQDPTASDEYTHLAEELAATEARLADAEALAAQTAQEPDAVRAEADVTAEVRVVQEQWFAAWNATDGDTVVSMMAPGGRHHCPATGAEGVNGADLAAFVEEGWQMTDAEIVSATRTRTPGDSALLSADYVVVTEFALNGHPGYRSVLHLRGPEGSLRILDHHAYP
jgi:hypothetical protein